MRQRYERRRAAKAKAAAGKNSQKSQHVFSTTSTGSEQANSNTTVTFKMRQMTVHSAAQIKLHVHGHEFQNGEEIILNPESFLQLKELVWNDYVVEVFHPDCASEQQLQHLMASDGTATALGDGSPKNHLLLEIPQSSSAPLKGKMQVSVLKDTAAIFQLAPFKDVTVRFLPKTKVHVDFVEVALKDQFLSRRDLMYLKQSMVGSALYVGKVIRVQGTRWQVLDVRSGGEKVRSGVISEHTKFTFRSRSSRIMWLVQICPEMWDVTNSGMLYLEIFLLVVQNLLKKWMKHKVSHSLNILFYSRCFYPDMDGIKKNPTNEGREPHKRITPKKGKGCAVDNESNSSFSYEQSDCFSLGVDESGRHYQDFYKLVASDSITSDVQPLLVKLKEELNTFPRECGWLSPANSHDLPCLVEKRTQDEFVARPGFPSNARNGNLLEAVNLALNIFEKHHIDRDLSRSGQSIVLITPGNGIFSVNKRLSEITEQRMMDHGIGIDLISLATHPLHKCPLFLFKQSDLSEMKLPGRKESNYASGLCLCNNNSHSMKNGCQRRSCNGSSDVLTDSQLALADIGVTPMRSGQLCKYCLQRMENCKNYIVPLWIPLWFVQENMLVPHTCPLDDDITQSCEVCAPKYAKNKIFEPLPMCRMFKKNSSLHSDFHFHPKPLARLLRAHHNAEPSLLYGDRNKNEGDAEPWTSVHKIIAPGLKERLARLRASSIVYSGGPPLCDSESLSKVRSISSFEQNKLLQEYESYDDEVFGLLPATKLVQKSSESDIIVRFASTPPTRLGVSYLTSVSKKRAGAVVLQSSLGGYANEFCSKGVRWRQFEQELPSPLNVGMTDNRKSLEDRIGSFDDGKDKARIISSSYPNTFQQTDGSESNYTSFNTSPVLHPTENARKDDIFHSQAFMLKQLTSNQRRWSQVRPYEDQRYKLAQNVLKWRSLCFPALLPLASDFMPAPKELQAHYTESFYSVMLPERDEQNGVSFRNYCELVLEMVAQRLSQDFQLISADNNDAGDKKNTTFRLSMGHRIHEIVYNEETQTIDVKRYLQKVTTRSDVDIMEYKYLLWSPIVDQFVIFSQEFRKYPQIEYQWNHLDQLICGYIDEMSEGIRYKRSLYCLFPPRFGGSDVGDQDNLRNYSEGCQKFLEFLQTKADASTDFPKLILLTDLKKEQSTSGIKAFKRVGKRSVKLLLHTNDAVTSQNWVIAKVDTEVLPAQCYHVEIQWVVCRSSLVDDLTTGMSRRAKQLGLNLQRVTENGITSNLALHPFNCPIFFRIDGLSEQQMVEKRLVERFDFCCEALHPISSSPFHLKTEHATVTDDFQLPRAHRVTSCYHQYVHRSLACFARMTQTGLIWISNQKERGDEIQPVFDELREYIESLQVARSAVMSVLNGLFKSSTASAQIAVLPVKIDKDSLQNIKSNKFDLALEGNVERAPKLLEIAATCRSTEYEGETEKENNPLGLKAHVSNAATRSFRHPTNDIVATPDERSA
ncbi:hypothetical protein CCR75_001816 [Bremia lactucae]|uniref:CST complex subunit CTC1 n=1 Tax=Bremia lactucae TaxID=4779 RepID=A0A976FFW7_BRELC|nr:hypothetical protein CCR75_001816 [Bremia lactucae]